MKFIYLTEAKFKEKDAIGHYEKHVSDNDKMKVRSNVYKFKKSIYPTVDDYKEDAEELSLEKTSEEVFKYKLSTDNRVAKVRVDTNCEEPNISDIVIYDEKDNVISTYYPIKTQQAIRRKEKAEEREKENK